MVRLLAASIALVTVMGGCSGLPAPTPESPTAQITRTPRQPLLVIDAGEVCFYAFNEVSRVLAGEFKPRGCYSSSCTQVLEQDVRASVDDGSRTLRFKSRFVLLDTTVTTPEAIPCTADCDGGGRIPFLIGGVTGEKYSVLLGEESLGELTVSEVGRAYNPVCLGER